jgi:hypothetical protein
MFRERVPDAWASSILFHCAFDLFVGRKQKGKEFRPSRILQFVQKLRMRTREFDGKSNGGYGVHAGLGICIGKRHAEQIRVSENQKEVSDTLESHPNGKITARLRQDYGKISGTRGRK